MDKGGRSSRRELSGLSLSVLCELSRLRRDVPLLSLSVLHWGLGVLGRRMRMDRSRMSQMTRERELI